jgi:hypothetical protein
MNRDPNIQSELNEIAPVLASQSWVMPYAVPVGYFDHVSDVIVEKVLLLDGNNQHTSTSMQVPEGYFDQLPQVILDRIMVEEGALELENVAPVLAGLEKRNPYNVPNGYFEQLNPMAFTEAATAPAKPIRLFSGKTMLRVAAALLLLLSAFLVWKMSGQTKSGDAPAEITINKADSMVLQQSLAAIDDTLLSTYFNDLGVAQETKSVGIMLETENIEQALSSFSETELETQLKENPVPASESGI